jgi:hypothetical protein
LSRTLAVPEKFAVVERVAVSIGFGAATALGTWLWTPVRTSARSAVGRFHLNDRFWAREAQLNTAVATFCNFDWANPTADCYVCDRCGYIHLLEVENPRGLAEGLSAFFARHKLPA